MKKLKCVVVLLGLLLTCLLVQKNEDVYAGVEIGIISSKTPVLTSTVHMKKGEEHNLLFTTDRTATDYRFQIINPYNDISSVTVEISDSSLNPVDTYELEKSYIGVISPAKTLRNSELYVICVKNAEYEGTEGIDITVAVFSKSLGGSEIDPFSIKKKGETEENNGSGQCEPKLVLSKDKLSLLKKKSTKLTATLPESLKGTGVTWKSSNKKVAMVSKNGKVTAKGYGKAVITCTSKKDKTLIAKCSITVAKKLTDEDITTAKDVVIENGKSGSNLVMDYQYIAGSMITATRYMTVRSNNYSGEVSLDFNCSDGIDTATMKVEKNKIYNLSYKYITKKTPDTVIKQPDQRIPMTDPLTGRITYMTIPGQTITTPAASSNINLDVKLSNGYVLNYSTSFAGSINKGSFSFEEDD